MARRLSQLDYVASSSELFRPLVCHLAEQTPDRDISNGVVLGSTTDADAFRDALHRALPASLRKGNLRGPGYVFVVAHVSELATLVDKDGQSWAWSLASDLGFRPAHLVLLLTCDDLATKTLMQVDPALVLSTKAALRQSARDAGGTGQLIMLSPTGRIDDLGDAVSPSRDAIVLLFELVASIKGTPGPALKILLEGYGGELTPGPRSNSETAEVAELDVLPQAPSQSDGAQCWAFGISSYGIDLASYGSTVGVAVKEAVLRNIENGDAKENEWPALNLTDLARQHDRIELPDNSAGSSDPTTDVVRRTPDSSAIGFSFRPRVLTDADSEQHRAIAAVSAVELALARRMETVDAAVADRLPAIRRGRAQLLEQSRPKIDVFMQGVWDDVRMSASEVAERAAESARRYRDGELRSMPKMPRRTQANFAALAAKLSDAIEARPGLSAIAQIALVFVAAWGAASGTLKWLSVRNAFGLALGPEAVDMGAAVVGVLALALATERYYLRPRRAVSSWASRIAASADTARQELATLENSLLEYANASVQRDFEERVAEYLAAVEEPFRETARAATEDTWRDSAWTPIPEDRNMFDRSVALPAMDDPQDHAHTFRTNYLPYEPVSTARTLFRPADLVGAIGQYARLVVGDRVRMVSVSDVDWRDLVMESHPHSDTGDRAEAGSNDHSQVYAAADLDSDSIPTGVGLDTSLGRVDRVYAITIRGAISIAASLGNWASP